MEPSVQQLQIELHIMTTKVEKLQRENLELRAHLRNASNER